MDYDLVIVGAGPAGLTAGIYGARAGLKTVILEMRYPGGLVATTDFIENYPAFPDGIKGFELAERMKQQVKRFKVDIINSEVTKIGKTEHLIAVQTPTKNYEALAAIIATGTFSRKLNVTGEDELRGRGVSYCAVCDGPLFRGKNVAVIGCGNSGLQEGKFLLGVVKSVTFVDFLPQMTGDKILQGKLLKEERATFLLNHEMLSINGTDRVNSITVKDRTSNQEKTMEIDGVFIYVGLTPNSEFLQGVLNLDRGGFIITDEKFQTSVSGIFAAGDIRSKEIRQIVTACSEGAEAALGVCRFIESHKM